ncbi:DgyrCDS7538 [Dimorphilus gyrociliatus]|uniref:DgyrCDS7538 n=1 Tax=Dimorphilus gyrociliatus TaxID=2664684 RepID=A0A7I8VTJ9_9ANNE|nr:DgyrCDS7538 [Dimorphilus gyrociliatus]
MLYQVQDRIRYNKKYEAASRLRIGRKKLYNLIPSEAIIDDFILAWSLTPLSEGTSIIINETNRVLANNTIKLLHNSGESVSILEQGIKLSPGFHYNLGIDVETIKLLPFPYGDCLDMIGYRRSC